MKMNRKIEIILKFQKAIIASTIAFLFHLEFCNIISKIQGPIPALFIFYSYMNQYHLYEIFPILLFFVFLFSKKKEKWLFFDSLMGLIYLFDIVLIYDLIHIRLAFLGWFSGMHWENMNPKQKFQEIPQERQPPRGALFGSRKFLHEIA